MAIFTRRGLMLGPKMVPLEPTELRRDHWIVQSRGAIWPLTTNGHDLTGQASVYPGLSDNDEGAPGKLPAHGNSSVGPALYWDGATTTLVNPKSPSLALPKAISFMAVVETPVSPSRQDIIQYSPHTTPSNQWWFNLQNNLISFYSDNIQGYYQSASSVPINKRTAIGCTYDGSTISFYIDGKLDNQISKAGNITLANNLAVIIGSNDGTTTWFTGFITPLVVAPAVFDAAQMAEFAAEPFGALQPVIRRRYYGAGIGPSGATMSISGGIGPIGAGISGAQSQSAALAAAMESVAAAIAASQSQSFASSATLPGVATAWELTQTNGAAVSARTEAVSAAWAASQAQGAVIAASTGATASAWSAGQSQGAQVAASAQSEASAISAAQSQSAGLVATLGSISSAWVLTQANVATMAIDATLGPVSSALAATQSQGASVVPVVGPVVAYWRALQSQSANAAGQIGPVASAWTLAQIVQGSMAVNATIGPISAAVAAAQSQDAGISSAVGPVASAWTIVPQGAWHWGTLADITVTFSAVPRSVTFAPVSRSVTFVSRK